MSEKKPQSRTKAAAPAATRHLDEDQGKALDVQADAEHTVGEERERLTRKIEKLGGGAAKPDAG